MLENESKVYGRIEQVSIEGEIDEFHGSFLDVSIRPTEKDLISRHLPDEKEATVMDLGCGGGWLSSFLNGLGFSTIGVDVTPSLLVHARSAAPSSQFVIADASRLPLRPSSVDTIISVALLHHLPNLQDAFRECYRVGACGCRLMLLEPNSLNLFTYVANRLRILDIHTVNERTLRMSEILRDSMSAGWKVERSTTHLTFSFAIGYLLRRASDSMRSRSMDSLADFVRGIDGVLERLRFTRCIGSTIFVVLRKD